MTSLSRPLSYSLITEQIINTSLDTKNNDTIIKNKNTESTNTNTNNIKITNDNDNNTKYNIINDTSTKQFLKPILPYCPNIYSKKYVVKWLCIKFDNNMYHFDYCEKLFKILMKWVKINGFQIKTNENILLAKFISLMYLLSNKKGYKEILY